MATRSVAADADASALRVVDLRSILSEHGVHVPHSARKADLVQLFEQHVRPALSRGAPRLESARPAATPRARHVRESLSTPRVSSPLARTPRHDADGFGGENVFQSARKPRTSVPREPEETTATSEPQRAPLARASTPEGPRKVSTPRATPQSQPTHTPKLRERAERLAAAAFEPAPAPEQTLIDASDATELAARVARSLRASIVRAFVWLAAAAWLWYCWRTRMLGFCPMGVVPEKSLWPQCTPCPELAICVDRVAERCRGTEHVLERAGYAKVPVLAQMLPLSWTAPRCVPDTFRLVLAGELADAIVAMLSHWHGQVLCGSAEALAGAPTHALGRFALPAAQVRRHLEERVDEGIDAGLFDSVWDMTLDGLQRHSDALVPLHAAELWYASPRPTLPLVCRLRLYVVDLLWRYRMRLAMAVAAIVAVLTAVRQVRTTRTRTQRAQECAAAVLAHLKEASDGPVPVNHLRDEMLHGVPDASARRQLWVRAARIVEQNANVRARQAQIHGQWVHVWEWLGTKRATSAPNTPAPTQPPAPHEGAERQADARANPPQSRI